MSILITVLPAAITAFATIISVVYVHSSETDKQKLINACLYTPVSIYLYIATFSWSNGHPIFREYGQGKYGLIVMIEWVLPAVIYFFVLRILRERLAK